MRMRQVMLAVSAGLGVLLLTWLWPSRCPLGLGLVTVEPSGSFDDEGSEFWLVTLGLTNRSASSLEFQKEQVTAEAKIGSRWVNAQRLSGIGRLGAHAQAEALLLVPNGTGTCRLRVNYQSMLWNWRLWEEFGTRGQEAMRKLPPKVFNRLWSIGPPGWGFSRPERWTTTSLEVTLPASYRAHNSAGPADRPMSALPPGLSPFR
jgi:hypothetical protein